MYARLLEKRPVAQCLFMIHAQSQALVRELFTVHKQRKIAGVIMLKFGRVTVQQTVKICVLNHGEQQTYSIDKDLDPAANVNVLSSTIVRL